MILNSEDLYGRELCVRTEAERIRFRWPESLLSDPSVEPGTKLHAKTRRETADKLDQVADLLVGLQGDWGRLGPLVREGYMSALRQFDAQKADPVDEEEAA